LTEEKILYHITGWHRKDEQATKYHDWGYHTEKSYPYMWEHVLKPLADGDYITVEKVTMALVSKESEKEPNESSNMLEKIRLHYCKFPVREDAEIDTWLDKLYLIFSTHSSKERVIEGTGR